MSDRVIKFRQPIYSPNNNFAYFWYWGFVLDEGKFQCPLNYDPRRYSSKPSEQFTERLDTERTELYHGDIFENYQASFNLIIWYEGQWCYRNHHAGALPLFEHLGDAKKLGDIHSNPELLERVDRGH